MTTESLDPDVAAALDLVAASPRGAEQVARAEEALRLAQRTGHFADELATRLKVVEAFYYVQQPPEVMAHFAWLRTALERPDGPNDRQRHRILWFMKWAMAQALNTPELPLSALHALFDDVEAVYHREGHSPRPVLAHRAWLARDCGDSEAQTRYVQAFWVTSRDSMSDCDACEVTSMADLTVPFDPVRAIEALTPVVTGGLTCAEEPHVALGWAALWAAEAGQPTMVERFHRRGWPLVDQDRALMESVARHLIALVHIGQAERAASLLTHRWRWTDGDCETPSRFWWQLMTAVVLRAAPITIPGGGPDAAEAAAQAEAEARDIARRFDTRNDSSVFSDTVEQWLRPVKEPTQPVAAAPGAGRPTDVAAYAGALRAALAEMSPTSGDLIRGWLQDRDRLLDGQRPSEAVAYLDRVTSRDLPTADRLRRLEAALAAAGDDPVATRQVLVELAAVHATDSVGPEHTGQVQRAETAAQELERLDVRAAAAAWSVLALELLTTAGADPHRSTGMLRRSAELYRQTGDRAWTAATLIRLAGFQDPPQDAATLADAAALIDTASPVSLRARLGAEQAMAALVADDTEQAERVARAVCDEFGTDEGALRARTVLIQVAVEARDWGRVETVARESVKIARDLDASGPRTVAEQWLGIALFEQGHHLEAAHWLETALPAIRAKYPTLLGQTAWALGNALAALGEHAEARTTLAMAATSYEAEGNEAGAADAQLHAGQAALDAGDARAALAHLESAHRLARRVGDMDTMVASVRLRAAIDAEDDPAAAAALLDQLPDEVVRAAADLDGEVAPEHLEFLRAQVLEQGAWILLQTDPRRAVQRMREAVDATTTGPLWDEDDRRAIRCRLVSMLAEDPANADEALAQLHRVLADATGPDQALAVAAGDTFDMLTAASRHHDAAQVEQEWGRLVGG